MFRLIAEAAGADASGATASCTLDLRFELRQETSRTRDLVTYSGVHGGHGSRQVLDHEGNGFAFFIDMFATVEVRLDTSGRLDIRIPINQTTTVPFYNRIARFEGTINATGFGNGSWTCAPLNLNQGGYVDTTVSVTGAWTVEPEPATLHHSDQGSDVRQRQTPRPSCVTTSKCSITNAPG